MRNRIRGHDLQTVAIVDTGGARLLHQVGIDVGAHPLTIGHLITRTRGDEESRVVDLVVAIGNAGVMTIEGEPTLEAATQIGKNATPPAMGREAPQIGLSVAPRQTLEGQRRQRCRRFAEREARVLIALHQQYLSPT